MPLTPADVHNVAFKKPSIGKRGYDEDEVDAFLDVVEAELSRLIEENAELTGGSSEFEAGGPPDRGRAVDTPGRLPPPPQRRLRRPSEAAHTQAARLLGCWPRRRPTGSPTRPRPNRTSCWRMPRASPTPWSATPPPAPRRPSGTAGSRPRRWTPRPRPATTRSIGKLADERSGWRRRSRTCASYEREYRGRLKSWISDQLSQLDGDAQREHQRAPPWSRIPPARPGGPARPEAPGRNGGDRR